MRREFHVRFCEGGGVRFPSATRPIVGFEHRHELRILAVGPHHRPTRLRKIGRPSHRGASFTEAASSRSNWARPRWR